MNAQPVLPITVIVLTRNEALHIRRCLERINPYVERVVVVDSFSSDETTAIARAFGADVHQRRWLNYAEQFQWALDHADIQTPWVLRLDADEYLEPDLIRELFARLGNVGSDVTGISLRRKVFFRGRWIRYGGYYPTVLLRLWRHGAGRIENRWMDEHIVLERGRSITFAHDFVDENLNDISWWTDKHNGYATRQMIDFVAQERNLLPVDESLASGQSGQAQFKRILKTRLFARMPLYLRGTVYFLVRYFLLLGFLDGRQGFLFHFLQGYWNWMLVDAKIDEARQYIDRHGLDAFKLHLTERWGYRL